MTPNMNNLKKLIHLKNKVIKRLFLIVYPPFGESSILDKMFGRNCYCRRTDILVTTGTSLEDIWTPVIGEEAIPANSYNEIEFKPRIDRWMKSEADSDMLLEYYEFTHSPIFNEIVWKKIESVELIALESDIEAPFGVKLLFEDDFIVSIPNTDGNQIITKSFNNEYNTMQNFSKLGRIVYYVVFTYIERIYDYK